MKLKNTLIFKRIKKKIIIILYSPKKKNTNIAPEYSVLKPETSSDSPSTRSIGVRLHSELKINSLIKTVRREISLTKTIKNKISKAIITITARSLLNILYKLSESYTHIKKQ